jgi:predicted AlkP superfamily phosphohydrolase/phosphomutase
MGLVKNHKNYSSKRGCITILALIAFVPLFLFGCTREKDKQIADLTKKLEEQSKQVEALTKQKEQDTAKRNMVLQESCTKSVNSYLSNNKEGIFGPIVNYTNHYNKKLNKCFILVDEAYKSGDSFGKVLIDVNENKDYGMYSQNSGKKSNCWVGDKSCESSFEWDDLSKPYMEE